MYGMRSADRVLAVGDCVSRIRRILRDFRLDSVYLLCLLPLTCRIARHSATPAMRTCSSG